MKNIIIVAVVFWALFLNGFSQIKQWAGGASLGNAPQAVITGAQRALATVAPQPTTARPTVPVAPQLPRLPTGPSGPGVVVAAAQPVAAPLPPTATPEPTRTPIPALEAPDDPALADDGNDGVTHAINWQAHQIPLADGRWQVCVFVYQVSKRTCWGPGVMPTIEEQQSAADGVLNGTIPAEPINSFG